MLKNILFNDRMYKINIELICLCYYKNKCGGVFIKNLLLIKNPIAGRNSTRISTDDIIRAFREYDIECFEKTTTCQGDGINIAKKYAADFDAIICCGGDGTYNEVINGLMYAGVDKPVIYLPCGSTNDFANTLSLTKDPHSAAKMYVDGLSNRYDIGTFNDKYFCYIASFGMATEISYSTSQNIKNLFGHSAYLINGFVLKLIPMIKNMKPAHMRIEYDDGVIDDSFYFGAVANTNEISGLFKLEKNDIRMNDGKFELLLVRGSSPRAVADAFVSALRQDYSGDNIFLVKTSKVKITAIDEVPWTLDGEYGGIHKEIDINVLNEQINVVSPKGRFLL